MKESFYKTFDEKILAKIVSGLYNEVVGGDECTFLDKGEDKCNYFTRPEEIAPLILSQIMSEEGVLSEEYNGEIWTIEAKHLRFMGKKRIEEIVNHRTAWMFKKFPPEYAEYDPNLY